MYKVNRPKQHDSRAPTKKRLLVQICGTCGLLFLFFFFFFANEGTKEAKQEVFEYEHRAEQYIGDTLSQWGLTSEAAAGDEQDVDGTNGANAGMATKKKKDVKWDMVDIENEEEEETPVKSRGRGSKVKVGMSELISICRDPKWCNVPMPSESHFKFSPPRDEKRWKQAQILASKGDQVLLSRIVKHFPNSWDYLDGDRSFRGLQKIIDVFVDSKSKLDALLPDADPNSFSIVRNRKLSQDTTKDTNEKVEVEVEVEEDEDEDEEDEGDKVHIARRSRKLQGGDIKPGDETTRAYHVDNRQVAPNPYNYRVSDRAPVVEMGYTAFQKNQNTFFSGNFAGGNFVKKEWFFGEWFKIKDKLDWPFITICSLNENWGLLSTNFPNRTAGWGACCQKKTDNTLHQFLDHDKTLMLIINQHSNISHPKLLTIPRGLPLTWEHTSKVVWDSQRFILKTIQKKKLLFAAASSWGKRPQILRCISDKMDMSDFEGHSDTPKEELEKIKTDRRHYYQKLGSSMFGVALPGLGYDCFRTWELLTMGSIVILERGVGLDRTLWRLPALLVDDFYDITPELLRSAYVEAMYRADDFEFERLTQSFWYSVVANVSSSKSTQPMLDKFPMEAEDLTFTRPRHLFDCHKTNSCGRGTKRVPEHSC